MHRINSESENIERIEINNSDINEYIKKLLEDTFANQNYKRFKLSCDVYKITELIIQFASERELDYEETDLIATEYLYAEIQGQESIKHIREIKHGNLIQVLFYYDNVLYFLISKVESDPFIVDSSIKKETGMPFKNKTLKTCFFKFNFENEVDDIFVIDSSNSVYWKETFLKLSPVSNDENSTKDIYSLVERKVKLYTKDSKSDYYDLHNSVACYFNQPRLFTYDNMVETIFTTYKQNKPEIVNTEKIVEAISKDVKKNNYDTSFKIVPNIISKSFKRTVKINDFIKLEITGEDENFRKKIKSIQKDGKKYIMIEVANDEAYESFKR